MPITTPPLEILINQGLYFSPHDQGLLLSVILSSWMHTERAIQCSSNGTFCARLYVLKQTHLLSIISSNWPIQDVPLFLAFS